MSNKNNQDYNTLTPHMAVKNASEAIEYYKKVFGAQEVRRLHTPNGAIMHADLKINDSHLFICDPYGMGCEVDAPAKSTVTIHFSTDDVDSVFARAVEHGATVDMPLQNMFWGARYGRVTDPFGQSWSLAQQLEELSTEEMQKRGDEFMKQAAACAK